MQRLDRGMLRVCEHVQLCGIMRVHVKYAQCVANQCHALPKYLLHMHPLYSAADLKWDAVFSPKNEFLDISGI